MSFCSAKDLSFWQACRSFQIVGPETLNGLKQSVPNKKRPVARRGCLVADIFQYILGYRCADGFSSRPAVICHFFEGFVYREFIKGFMLMILFWLQE